MREYEEMSKSELVNIIESRDDEVEDLQVIIKNQEVIISDITYDKEELEAELAWRLYGNEIKLYLQFLYSIDWDCPCLRDYK